VRDLTQAPAPADALLAGPTTILFDPAAGAVAQIIHVDNQNAGHAIAWEAVASAAWIQLSATAGTTPGDTTATFVNTGLSAGLYTATITFTGPDAPAGDTVIYVQVDVPLYRAYLPLAGR